MCKMGMKRLPRKPQGSAEEGMNIGRGSDGKGAADELSKKGLFGEDNGDC